MTLNNLFLHRNSCNITFFSSFTDSSYSSRMCFNPDGYPLEITLLYCSTLNAKRKLFNISCDYHVFFYGTTQ